MTVYVRGLTADALHEAVMDDAWPSCGAVVDFDLRDQEHYEALYYPIREGEITLEELREIVGDGKKITEKVNACPSNPHKGIVFRTAYDAMREASEDEGDDEEAEVD